MKRNIKMNFKETLSLLMKKSVLGVILLGASAIGISGHCLANGDNVETQEEILTEIAGLDTVENYCNYYDILESDNEEFIKEVENMIDERGTFSMIDANSEITTYSSSSSPLKKDRNIPESAYADIIWTNNPLTPFNHVGIYTANNKITEALANGVKTRTVGKKMKEYPFITYKVVTKSNGNTRYSLEKRKSTAAWAKGQVGRSYDTNFANNKENTSASNKKFNCSELVWKAWKFKGKLDLDSNGGKGVYPNNIKDSNRTKVVYQSK